uniref:Delta-aminolevulinic acid dehydratase n=1 Tax=Fibrocapsa japonica TaxID=94617 RepID=A0A7S2XYQ0_9STRA|mmetsp:Transcript_3571/g.5279  ORF Transcript_3571/g.5279 Transcript_3571/m.5279 type:complete len:404 (+) Transcript_3571:72-1283(+)|eukprot:CAMPEP_0113943588 /NCGR_PEP_ID=MMETSP1339-20121228/26696_1 /TAXON_ID=94617 /ORGANISM="Fibrocapsa japonica" /LENGTH=403 /DNA_ID=CAMNT_0000948497 /DNA_START=69 /DNA_END=1280 /DNA_ORIENTATION=+ /assembly_acc=CAM_ASM_000762
MALQTVRFALLAILLILGKSAAFQGWSPSQVSQAKAVAQQLKVLADDKLTSSDATDFDPTSGPSAALKRNNLGNVWNEQRPRPRRNRKSEAMRSMVRETIVTPSNFIYPLFIHEEDFNQEIASMPGCERHSLPSMIKEAEAAWKFGVRSFVLFPKVDDKLKTNYGEESYNPNGIVPRAVSMLKDALPDSIVCTDVALDPYSDQGHDGIVRDGKILNDETIEQLCKQSVCQARAGSDVVAPSDMMDGRVKAIRDALDSEGFTNVSILSYTAKYASAYYGPFRDALDSHPGFGDKKTYQQDPANGREALVEAALDVAEGADMLMVKPGMPYLDIIYRLKQATNLPIAAYHVSGEYAMLKAAVERGWLDEKKVVLETLTCFKRAGADIVLTYYAKQAAQWLCEDGF